MLVEQRWRYFSSYIRNPNGMVLFKKEEKESLAEITSASDVRREKEHRVVKSLIIFS